MKPYLSKTKSGKIIQAKGAQKPGQCSSEVQIVGSFLQHHCRVSGTHFAICGEEYHSICLAAVCFSPRADDEPSTRSRRESIIAPASPSMVVLKDKHIARRTGTNIIRSTKHIIRHSAPAITAETNQRQKSLSPVIHTRHHIATLKRTRHGTQLSPTRPRPTQRNARGPLNMRSRCASRSLACPPRKPRAPNAHGNPQTQSPEPKLTPPTSWRTIHGRPSSWRGSLLLR